MSSWELQTFLRANTRAILVTNGPGGIPHPVPMSYGIDEQDRILMACFGKGQKVKNLERDLRAAILVENGRTYSDLRAVIVYADAEIITDPDRVSSLISLVRTNKEMTETVTPAMRTQAARVVSKRVILRFVAQRYVSWDHAKLGNHY